MKIIVTWLAFYQDFIQQGETLGFKSDGFTGNIHHEIFEKYGFDKHVIITSRETSELKRKCMGVLRFMKDTYPLHDIEIIHLDIGEKELQDYDHIENVVRSYVMEFDATNDIHVIAGTGPTVLSMVWSHLRVSIERPFHLHLLTRAIHNDAGLATLKELNLVSKPRLDNILKEHHFSKDLPTDIFVDDIVKKEYEVASIIADAIDINVLLLGETGCGKDKMAEYIFRSSSLKNKNYTAINCASLPDDVLYSELFGHEKGAFTGAIDKRTGLFEECNGGTLFLDEIGDISPFMQQSLLRALENKEIKRLGSNSILKNIQVRVIAATNANLYEKCKAEKFRWDLYYRLCTTEILINPYRNRDNKQKKKVIEHFWAFAEQKWGRKSELDIETKKILENYSFPGNFREIWNSINGLFALNKKLIVKSDLPARFSLQDGPSDESYESLERDHSKKIYEKYKGNMNATCKALGHKNAVQLKQKFIKMGILP